MAKKKHYINIIFVITLLCMFAFTALSVAVMGARVYSHSAENMKANYETRTSLVYISEKIKQSPRWKYDIRKVGAADALVLKGAIGDEDVESWIFESGGQLKEAVLPAGTQATASDGNKIMTVRSMTFRSEGKLLIVTVVNPEGEVNSLTISRRE